MFALFPLQAGTGLLLLYPDKLPTQVLEAVVGVAREIGEILTPGRKDQIRADVPITTGA